MSVSPISPALWLMTAYVVVAFALQAVAVVVGMVLDNALGGWSMPVFLAIYFLMFWLAWPIALRITEPSAQKSEA